MDHPVPAELARRFAGSGRVALRVVALASTTIDRYCSLGSTGFDQENSVSSGTAAGVQDLVDTVPVGPQINANSECLNFGQKSARDG